MWILYALNVISAIIAIATALDVYSYWMTDKRPTAIHSFYYKTEFFIGEPWFSGRMEITGLIALLLTILIIVKGRKETFSSKSVFFLILPYIIPPITHLLFAIIDFPGWGLIHNKICFFNTFLLIITQIYLIIKLAKATKQLKA